MKKKSITLTENKRPAKLLKLLESNPNFTLPQLAKELQCSEMYIRNMIWTLQRKGFRVNTIYGQKKPYVYRPRANTQVAKLLQILDSGAKLTRPQMAKKLNCSVSRLGSIMNTLRKKGFLIGTVGTIRNPYTGISIAGKIANGAFNEKDYEEITNWQSTLILGNLQADFKMAETACLAFPHLQKQIVETIENFQMKILMGKKQLPKQLDSGTATTSHANSTNSA